MTHYSGASRRRFLAGLAGLTAITVTPLGVTRTAVAGPTATAHDAVAQPHIANCAQWAARPPSSDTSVLSSRPNKIIVHHTVSENTDDFSQAQAFAHAHWVQDLHMDNNGWKDTGYNFINSRGGWFTEGRHGSLFTLIRNNGNTMVQGAHTRGQNTQAIGIANEGAYHDGAEPPDAQWNSLIDICAFTCQQYGIPPAEIYGHKDFSATLCPGIIHDRLPELRNAVATKLGVS